MVIDTIAKNTAKTYQSATYSKKFYYKIPVHKYETTVKLLKKQIIA